MKYNKAIRDALTVIDNAIGEAIEALTTERDALQDKWNDRSEKWQESEKGYEAQERIDTLSAILDQAEVLQGDVQGELGG